MLNFILRTGSEDDLLHLLNYYSDIDDIAGYVSAFNILQIENNILDSLKLLTKMTWNLEDVHELVVASTNRGGKVAEQVRIASLFLSILPPNSTNNAKGAAP